MKGRRASSALLDPGLTLVFSVPSLDFLVRALLHFTLEHPRPLRLVKPSDFEDLRRRRRRIAETGMPRERESQGRKRVGRCQRSESHPVSARELYTARAHLGRVEPAVGAALHDGHAFTRHLVDGNIRVGRLEDARRVLMVSMMEMRILAPSCTSRASFMLPGLFSPPAMAGTPDRGKTRPTKLVPLDKPCLRGREKERDIESRRNALRYPGTPIWYSYAVPC